MSLGDLAGTGDKHETPSKNSSSSSSSGGSNKESYPKFETRSPYAAVYCNNDDELVFKPSPQYVGLVFKKKSKDSSWKLNSIDPEIEKYWKTQMDMLRTVHMVDDILDIDLVPLLQEDAEKGVRAINQAAKQHTPGKVDLSSEKCPVCREENDVIYGDYEFMQGRRVCSSHSVTEIVESGFID